MRPRIVAQRTAGRAKLPFGNAPNVSHTGGATPFLIADSLLRAGGCSSGGIGMAWPGTLLPFPSDVADGSSVGVVEVMPGSKELDDLSAGFVESVEQAGVQALREEDVGGKSGLHHLLGYSSGRVGGVAEGVRQGVRLKFESRKV